MKLKGLGRGLDALLAGNESQGREQQRSLPVGRLQPGKDHALLLRAFAKVRTQGPEAVLAIVGGLFVVETLSVIIQVLYYKRTKKRIFLMAPIHHHFEKKGWAEPQIVIRFWIISLILALLGLATLKVR